MAAIVLWSRLKNNNRARQVFRFEYGRQHGAALQRDAIGVGFILLSGLGGRYLPTIARFVYLDGDNMMIVGFTRGIIAVALAALFGLEKLSRAGQ